MDCANLPFAPVSLAAHIGFKLSMGSAEIFDSDSSDSLCATHKNFIRSSGGFLDCNDERNLKEFRKIHPIQRQYVINDASAISPLTSNYRFSARVFSSFQQNV